MITQSVSYALLCETNKMQYSTRKCKGSLNATLTNVCVTHTGRVQLWYSEFNSTGLFCAYTIYLNIVLTQTALQTWIPLNLKGGLWVLSEAQQRHRKDVCYKANSSHIRCLNYPIWCHGLCCCAVRLHFSSLRDIVRGWQDTPLIKETHKPTVCASKINWLSWVMNSTSFSMNF